MGEVCILPGLGKRDPAACLEVAKHAKLDEVLVIGNGPGGFYIGGSMDLTRDICWLLHQAEVWLAGETDIE